MWSKRINVVKDNIAVTKELNQMYTSKRTTVVVLIANIKTTIEYKA